MSTNNICFHREIRKNITRIPPLNWSDDVNHTLLSPITAIIVVTPKSPIKSPLLYDESFLT